MTKTSKTHPYAAIEHRVIDSPAFATLRPSSCLLLVLIVRQLTKSNNGHLQATYSYMSKYGINSEKTLSRSIRQLIAHGFIYRTRAGGYQKGAAQYAVTWLSITKRDGLFLSGFKPCAWRDWSPNNRNFRPPKVQSISGKNGMCPLSTTVKSAVSIPPKNADNELIPIYIPFTGDINHLIEPPNILRLPRIANGRLHPISQHYA